MKIQSFNCLASQIQINIKKQKSKSFCRSNCCENCNINELSGLYYPLISFGRPYEEHTSWGGKIDEKTKEVSFKIFTYPDTKKVEVIVKKRNDKNTQHIYNLENRGEGIWEIKNIPSKEVQNGDFYSYRIYKGNGDIDTVKDPYSARQECFMEESTIYDHSLFKWNDNEWFNSDKTRISRKANEQNKLSKLSSARIYEFNTATLTKQGTFQACKDVLQYIKNTGFNAIEIMPVEATYSINWGYDGVDKHTPSEYLGGPDNLKQLINTAHNVGLNVIMDIVPNHLGPDGASLKTTGPYISGSNAFGEGFNYEGQNNRYVRDFIINSGLNWLKNYHCDGLRLDMTDLMSSDATMKQFAAEIHYHQPDAFLIAEDARGGITVVDEDSFPNPNERHDMRITNPLKNWEADDIKSEQEHCSVIEQISKNDTSLSRIGFESQWDFNYNHELKNALYGVGKVDDLMKACISSQKRVKYVMSHDEIGNHEGTRLIAKLMVPILSLNENVILKTKDQKRAKDLAILKNCSVEKAEEVVKLQKAQFVAEKFAKMIQEGTIDQYSKEEMSFKKLLNLIGVNDNITYKMIINSFNESFEKFKMAMALTYSVPGPKMVFQGDEKADLTPFRFFREFESVKDETFLHTEKGYKPGRYALKKSKPDSLKYSQSGKQLMSEFNQLTKDLNKLHSENPALSDGKIIKTLKHPYLPIISMQAKDENSQNEIFTVTNFTNYHFPENSDSGSYNMNFPKGLWQEIINTNDSKYGGSGKFVNPKNIVCSVDDELLPIKIPSHSTLIFKKLA